MAHINDSLAAMNVALSTLQTSVDALLESRSGLTSTEIEARIQAAVQAAIDAVLAELDNYDAATVLARLEQIKQVFDIANSVGDERYFYEFFRDPFTAADADLKVSILGTVAGDNSVDVSDSSKLTVGETYVLSDTDGSIEVVEVAEILTAARFLAKTNLAKTRSNTGTLFRTSWDLSTAGKATVGNGAYYSNAIEILSADSSGRLLIRRDAGDGTVTPYARRIINNVAQAWQPCTFVSSTAADDSGTLVDLLYTIPVGGRVEIRVDSALGPSNTAYTIYYMVAMTPFRAGRADSVRQPTITAPADGATGIASDTPTITGDAYYSLYGVTQASMDLEIATDVLFNAVVYSGQETGTATAHIVEAGHLAVDTAYFARLRYTDTEGAVSAWSEVVGFSTGATFQYVIVPTITTPAEGALKVALTPTIQTSQFASMGLADTHAATHYQIAADVTFADIVYDSGDSADLTMHVVPTASALDRLVTYALRVRHKGATIGYSGWSATRTFTTINAADAPAVTSPANGATGVTLPVTITTSAFSFPGGGEAHIATQYQIAEDAAFANVVFDSGASANLTSYTVPSASLDALTMYYVRARQEGATTGWSPWSATVQFTTAVSVGEAVYTIPGSYDFIVPGGVTSVCVVCVGGGSNINSGGGGGGGLGWRNDISVVPGQSIAVTVGSLGGTSSFGTVLSATGGSGTTGGHPSGHTGGGNGGDALRPYCGAGAGGYSGDGGDADYPGHAGSGGGGGGGAPATSDAIGSYGGGVGLYGEGSSGAGSTGYPDAGKPGSGGSGALYGGGKSGTGAVRIIWGPSRSFPNNAA